LVKVVELFGFLKFVLAMDKARTRKKKERAKGRERPGAE